MQPHTTIIATREGRNYVCFTNDTVRRRRLELLGDVYPGNGEQGGTTAEESLLLEHLTDEVDYKGNEERDDQECDERLEDSATEPTQAEPNLGERSRPGQCCPVCEEWVTDASSIEYARPKADDDEPILDGKSVKYGPPSTEVMQSVTHAQQRALIDPNERLKNAWDWHGKAELTFCEDIIGPGQVHTTPASSSWGYEEQPRPARIITDSTGMSKAVTLLNIQRMKDQTPSYKAWEERQH